MPVSDKGDEYATELEREMRERRSLEAELARTKADLAIARQLALHDALTGLPNRTLFTERVEHALRQAARHRWTLALLFIDLDGFKQVNDRYGHEAGDELLVAVAATLGKAVRAEDTVCRYGGDEFACLLLNVTVPNDAMQFASALERRIVHACSLDERMAGISASIGIALHPEHGASAEALLRHADAAMYQAKGTSERVVFYEPECAD